MDYTTIFEQVGTIIELCLPIGIGLGLAERLVSFALDAMFDRVRRSERI